MEKVFNSVLELIGNTPLLELKKIEKEYNLKGRLIAKIEKFNPGGSIKERPVLMIVNNLLKTGKIDKDTIIIEPTSGNTGIALSLVCAYYNLNLILVMPENMSEERKLSMKAYGAKLVLTPCNEGMKGAIKKAELINKEIKNSVILGQFTNEMNPLSHYETTGKEIYSDLEGKIDCLIAGIGTGGTISGISKYLKEKNPKIKAIGIEPLNSPIISDGYSGIHKIQGIGAGFIPQTLDLKFIDKVVKCSDEDAFKYARICAKTEGLLVGISSGAVLFHAINYLQNEGKGETVVIIFPDGGERYLSTELFNYEEE